MTEIITSDFWAQTATTAVRICFIVIAAFVLQRFSGVVIDRYFYFRGGMKTFHIEAKRAQTLTELLKTLFRYSIYFISLVAVLAEFHIDTTSLIAGAGVLGLALGVGAQSLIKDFITGFFIILEDQYAMGDYVVVGDMAGKVEEVGFRVTKLRDVNGVLHIVPNGSIVKVSNHTRAPLQATVNMPVAHEANIDQALELITQACHDVKDMPEVVEAPKIIGIVDYRATDVIVRVVAKTVPLEQVKVETALRYRIKQLFVEAGIPLPPPPLPAAPMPVRV